MAWRCSSTKRRTIGVAIREVKKITVNPLLKTAGGALTDSRKHAMVAVTATEFAKSFGRYEEEARRGPVAITRYGRVSGCFVSAREYEGCGPS